MADFLEIMALTATNSIASGADLLGPLDISDDVALDEILVDPETGEETDQQILEEPRQALLLNVFEEFAYRQECLGGAHPFVVDYETFRITYTGGELVDTGHLVYVFCLLVSALREKRFELNSAEKALLAELVRRIGNCFQICACLAAGAYFSGHVASFGFPRAAGDSFLPALRAAYKRFGVGEVRATNEDVLVDLPNSVKDGGIDVIAWKDMPDRMPGKLYLVGQCASGSNWRSKSVVEYIEQLHGTWFTENPAKHCTPAMFIPFTFHHDLTRIEGRSYIGKIRTNFWSDERRYGIIFDRLRIAFLAGQFAQLSVEIREGIDGNDRKAELKTWIDAILQHLANDEVAA